MGTLLDSSVLVRLERAGAGLSLPDGEDVAIAAITVSELLHGVHRADPARRPQREAFVENVLSIFPVVAFDVQIARVHARLWANLAGSGQLIGPHDMIIAATALTLGWSLTTLNVAEFSRVPGLDVRRPAGDGSL